MTQVLNGLLAITSTWLLRRKPQLTSQLGLCGQLALQLSMYRKKPVPIQECICYNMVNFRSALFAAVNWTWLNAPRDITDLYVSIESFEETGETRTEKQEQEHWLYRETIALYWETSRPLATYSCPESVYFGISPPVSIPLG